MTRSWVTGAEAPVSPHALADPGKIASMRPISTTLNSENAIWTRWTRMSGWWKSCSFLLLLPPNFLAGILTSEPTATRDTWRVPRFPLPRRSIPTVTSPPRILSTLLSCSSYNSSRLRILSQPLPRSLVNSGSPLNNHPLLRHLNITTTLISSLVPMMSTSTVADTRDPLWLLHSMGSLRTYPLCWTPYCEPDG